MATASIPAGPGETIAGKYLVERVLGTGGVGMVVAARHLTLGQTFAIKFLLPHAAHDQNDIRRFLREAQSAVQLKNEHVARVIDVAELEDGSPFIVLEYLEGRDLGALLRNAGPFPVEDAVGYLLQVCEAVAEAHSLGMVHRDLKPSNFFLTYHRDGSPLVKVLDFGIAKYKQEVEEQDARLTQTRALLGSPVYMSPEQVRSARTVDARSDIWSLGVSLFELLTDTVPFGGETVTSVAAAVTSDPVPAIALYRTDVPTELAAVIERCLAKRPEDRYQSVSQLAEALVAFGPPEGVHCFDRIARLSGTRLRVAGSDLRDSARRSANLVPATQVTQVTGETPGEQRAKAPERKRLLLAVGTGVIAALVVLLLASRWSSPNPVTLAPAALGAAPKADEQPNPATASTQARGQLEPTVAPIAPVATLATTASALASAPALASAAQTGSVSKPNVAARSSRTKAATVARPNAPTDGATGKKPAAKTPGGGSIEDIVDTRH